MATSETSPQRPRPTRVDARRNYERLVTAAWDAFAQHGVDASLNDIARRAGVGPATLYRHFPTREALLEALLAERYTDLADQADKLLACPDPSDALRTWLTAFISQVTTFRGLALSVKTALQDQESALFASCHAMQDAWRELVTHAQRRNIIRADVDASDLLRLANAIAWTSEGLPNSADQADRLLRLVFEGIQHQQPSTKTGDGESGF